MDLIRKERNLLLSRASESEKNDESIETDLFKKKQKERDDDLLTTITAKEKDKEKEKEKEKEKQDFSIFFTLYESYLTWIQYQSADLLSDQVFKYSVSAEKNQNDGQSMIPKRASIGFESLSPPSKNLILALGDVQLQKTSAEEIHLCSLFNDLSSMAKSLWLTLVSARSSLRKKIKESTEKRVEIEAKLLSEMFSSPEYLTAISEIESMEKALKLQIEIHTSVDSITNKEKYKKICERNRTITKCLDKLSSSCPKHPVKNKRTSTTLLSEIDQRLKLRIRKNEISKQKLLELSKTSTSASNLTIALDTLRIAEQEMDESILILNNSISNSSKAEEEEEEEDEEEEEEDNDKNLRRDEIINLFSKHKSVCSTLSCIGVKLRLLKTSIDDEILDERNKYQSELTSFITRDCSTSLDYVKEIILTKQTLFTNDLKKLGRLETTLKSELQSLLRIVRNDSRAVEQCVRSVTETAKSRSDQIQKSNFFRHVTFLQDITHDTTITNAFN
jgi:hypothetical protein